MPLLHGPLEQVLVEIVEAEGIGLGDSKVHDFELGDIVDHCTAEVTVFDLLFSDTDERNGLRRYRCSTYYY